MNFRAMFSVHAPAEGSISEAFSVLAELQQAGLIRHLGVSNVTETQIEEARAIKNLVVVQLVLPEESVNNLNRIASEA